MKENVRMIQQDSETLAIKMLADDCSGVHMTGQTIDRVYKNGVLVDEIVGHNLVVNSFLNLVMCLLKQQSGYTGIGYWAIGSGNASWDSQAVTPEVTASRLTSEIGRVAIDASEIKFLTPSLEETTSPTNIIQISHTFGPDDCNGTWREFGIFGGNATSSLNSGIMINKRHHGVITKTEEMSIERIMRFTLSLV